MTSAQSVNSLISLDPAAQAKRSAFWRLRDRVTHGLAAAGAGTMILMLLLLTYVLVEGALPAIRTFGFKFFIETDWDPVEMHFGAASMIFGTIVTSVLAMVIAVPLSIGVALFLNRIGPRWLEPIAGFLIELLAAIPSITYGFWGVAVLVPWLQKTGMPFLKGTVGQVPYLGKLFSGPAFGFSILAASLVLAIMVLPIITLVARDVLKVVPTELEQGAYALGATWWQATKLILIYAKLGLLGAVTLGFARAVGETMAVTMIIGNRNAIDASLFAPGQTMSSLLANEFLEADKPEYLQALVYVAATLLLFTLLMNVLARWCITLVDKQKKRPAADDGDMSQLNLDRKEKEAKKPAAAPESALPASFKQEPPFHVFRVKFTNKLVRGLCVLSFAVSMTLLCAILGYVLYRGFSSVSLDFFTKLPGPTGTPIGMRNCLVGTVILVGI
ncbi:MAG: phosphate ABC transporter permease subunit PstC, partial [Planctomycetes bacterium]|nr:phosphate ABC transporter permease subunit PstC [Planctomycetota bacterium]